MHPSLMMPFRNGKMRLGEFCGDIYLALFMLLQSVACLGERERWHPKYPPVIWFPEFPMFNNRTNPARIVVQMHDSLDFFCPDYINSQYQSFTGSKKHPTTSDHYGAEEIYMVDGQDYQSCFSALAGGRLSKKHVRLLLRCPGKTSDTRIKAKYQYTVSFRMFSPVPKGPEFNCNQEYYFLGIFPGHNHDEEAIEKALCSTHALRLQIFVSCSDIPSRHMVDPFSSPNVIQLDRPAQPQEPRVEASPIPASTSTTEPSVQTTMASIIKPAPDPVLFHRKPSFRASTRPSAEEGNSGGVYIAASDRKIMRANNIVNRHTSRRTPASRQTTSAMADIFDDNNLERRRQHLEDDEKSDVTSSMVVTSRSIVTSKPNPSAFYRSGSSRTVPFFVYRRPINFLMIAFLSFNFFRSLNGL